MEIPIKQIITEGISFNIRNKRVTYSNPKLREATKKIFNINAEKYTGTEPKVISTPLDKTTRLANTGDYIITGKLGEKYTMTPKEFDKRYDFNPMTNIASTKPVTIKYREVPRLKTILANWGEPMTIKQGGAQVYEKLDNRNYKSSYGIQPEAFNATYTPRK